MDEYIKIENEKIKTLNNKIKILEKELTELKKEKRKIQRILKENTKKQQCMLEIAKKIKEYEKKHPTSSQRLIRLLVLQNEDSETWIARVKNDLKDFEKSIGGYCADSFNNPKYLDYQYNKYKSKPDYHAHYLYYLFQIGDERIKNTYAYNIYLSNKA